MPQVVNHPQLGRINFPDEMPPDEVRSALSRLDEQLTEQSKPYRAAETMRAMPVAGGGQIYPTPTPREAARGLATTVEIGAPIAGFAAAGPAGGAVAGGLGDVLGQFIRMGGGLQQEAKPLQPLYSGAYGMLGGPAVTGPATTGLRTLIEAGKSGLGIGMGAGTIESVRSIIEKGRAPTLQEQVVPVVLPAVAGGAISSVSQVGQFLTGAAAEVAENIGKYSRAGIRNPTPGQLNPPAYAGLETRIATREPGGEVSQAVQRTYRDLTENLQGISKSGDYEPANVFQNLKTRLENRNLQADLEKLNDRAKASQAAVDAARERARAAGQMNNRSLMDEYNRLSDQAFTDSLDSALENARRIKAEQISGGATPLLPAQARDRLVEEVIAPMKGAYKKHWDDMYGFFPDKEARLASKPIKAIAESAYKATGKSLPADLEALLEEEKISLFAARQIRDKLYTLGSGPGGVEKTFRQAASDVTENLSAQADTAFGPELGEQYRMVNADYRAYSDLWDKPGAEVLLAKNIDDAAVSRIVTGLKQSGIASDAFRNVIDVIGNLASPQQAKAIVATGNGRALQSVNAKVNPELASVLKGHFLDLVRGNILDEASVGNKVNERKMLNLLREIGRDNKTLEYLGLGSMKQLDELETLFKEYNSASDLTTNDWAELWASPAFKQAYEQGETIATLIKPILQETEISRTIARGEFLRQLGKSREADAATQRAIELAGNDARELASVRARIDAARRDPLFSVFNQPAGAELSADSYNALKSTLFDPSASKPVNNKFVGEVFDGLRQSKAISDQNLLRNLQNEYLMTYLADFGQVGQFERLKPAKLASTVSKEAGLLGRGELERAKAILDTDQFEALKETARAAQILNLYEAYGKAGVPRSDEAKAGRLVKEGWYAVADLIRNNNYEKAFDIILNDPKLYAKHLSMKGQSIEARARGLAATLGPAMEQVMEARESQQKPRVGPMGLSRFMPQQRQAPANVLQFSPAR